MTRLIHLNGPPGIGKSTLAQLYVKNRDGVLNCDIDVLRTLIGGWSEDFGAAGDLIRPAALAMIRAYLETGHDVVLPQMLLDSDEVELFERSAHDAGAEFVEIFLMDEPSSVVNRFNRDATPPRADAWRRAVHQIVAAQGGDDAVTTWCAQLEQLVAGRPDAEVVLSADGDVEATYELVLAALA